MPIIYGIIGAVVGYIFLFVISLGASSDGAIMSLSFVYLSGIIFGCTAWIVETIKKHSKN